LSFAVFRAEAHRMQTLQRFWPFVGKAAFVLSWLSALTGSAQPGAPAVVDHANPFGISTSASSIRTHQEWFPKMSAAGVGSVRMFPEWRSVEPTQGQWTWERQDAIVKSATEHKLQITALLMGSCPWSNAKSHAFPMPHLDEWSRYVAASVARYKGQIHDWEVWNEGNGGFNDEKHTTADYARLVAATYAAAKQADPQARVGLTVASYDAPYLQETMRALKQLGKPDSFDFLAIHPYEIADGMRDRDGEIPYLWMTKRLRDVLAVHAPNRRDVPIWITEVGRRIEQRSGHTTTEDEAASALFKIYALAIAQGIARVQWFEAQDPVGEDQGFGVLARDGRPRASYRALETLAKELGKSPQTLGWVALGESGQGYGFVFDGTTGPVLAAWLPAGPDCFNLPLSQDTHVFQPGKSAPVKVDAGQAWTLTEEPVLIVPAPGELVAHAKANAGQPYPWGGDYSQAAQVSVRWEHGEQSRGLAQAGSRNTPRTVFPDGSEGIFLNANQGVSFRVHPSFANLQTHDFYVRITVRRLGPGNLGMNLFYEVADSQGRTPYKNKGIWYGVGPGEGWQTHTWHVTDACFSTMWGFDLSFRPEQSVPFVVGKVEVSKVPF